MTPTAPASKWLHLLTLDGGEFTPSGASIITEKELPITVNGEHLATASITPLMEREFVIGYLFGQGFIQSIAEITKLEVTGQGAFALLAKADLLSGREEQTSYRIVSGGGRSAYFEASSLPHIDSDLKIPREEIFRAMSLLFEKATLHKQTGGAHSAALFDASGNILCAAEDIGRHNTLDKIIGYALLNGIDCTRTFLVSTGRMASEMVIKIVRAGIPVAATKTAVTDQGREIGKTFGLTLIGAARDAGSKLYRDMGIGRIARRAEMKIYTGAERVL